VAYYRLPAAWEVGLADLIDVIQGIGADLDSEKERSRG